MKSKIKEMLRPIIMEILAERKKSIPTTPALSTEYLFKNIFGLSEKEAKKSIREAVKGLNQSQPWSNLFIKGWGKDRNGNSSIIIGFPNDKGWSIQTNQNLPKTHSILTSNPAKLTSTDLEDIGEEITDYVDQYGSKDQKSRLKRH